ncbi:MAG: tocopherol cyclase family protein [Acidimicrobiales bacterium]|nr:tocopherol cyclase family protein [Acidimicrobiales bacterium]
MTTGGAQQDQPSWLMRRVQRAYRRTGADLPGGDPRPTHHAEMEGWFWRFTDVRSGRVVVALCGVNRHPAGSWATVAVAVHPGDVVRSAAVGSASASAHDYEVHAGNVLVADGASLAVHLEDVHLAVRLDHLVGWPHRLGAGGIFSAVPFLGQYWHPHVLGGRASGTVRVGHETWTLDGANVYAEKNWGAGFPRWWWWGQAQGFARRDVCLAFGGGRLAAGPFGASVTGCVLRLGSEVVRFAPPAAIVRAGVDEGRWTLRARRRGWRLEAEGHGDWTAPALLPVPLPAERRNIDRDLEHLAARLRLRAWKDGTLVLDDHTRLAALEVGSTDDDRFRQLAHDAGVPVEPVVARPSVR